MIGIFFRVSLLSSFALVASVPVIASGSSGGGGSYPSSTPSAPRDPFADAYSRGKSLFKKHITCKKCDYPQGVNDSVTASKVAKRISSGEFQMNAKQRSDLMIFLQRRYDVTA